MKTVTSNEPQFSVTYNHSTTNSHIHLTIITSLAPTLRSTFVYIRTLLHNGKHKHTCTFIMFRYFLLFVCKKNLFFCKNNWPLCLPCKQMHHMEKFLLRFPLYLSTRAMTKAFYSILSYSENCWEVLLNWWPFTPIVDKAGCVNKNRWTW